MISVFDKNGLEPIVKALHQNNVTIYSTSGTETFIKDLGIPVVAVEDITAFPEILGGRVKPCIQNLRWYFKPSRPCW